MSPLIKGGDHSEIDNSAFLENKEYSNINHWLDSFNGLYLWVDLILRLPSQDDAIVQISTKSGTPWTNQPNLWISFQDENSVIRVWNEEPDYSDIPMTAYDWEFSVYGGAKEEILKDAPVSLCKPVVTTTYVNANQYHCMLTGKSVSGILRLFNKTPNNYYMVC